VKVVALLGRVTLMAVVGLLLESCWCAAPDIAALIAR
jgi:hypothetical protein